MRVVLALLIELALVACIYPQQPTPPPVPKAACGCADYCLCRPTCECEYCALQAKSTTKHDPLMSAVQVCVALPQPGHWACGSGVIVTETKKGMCLVLTNKHVVEEAREQSIYVVFSDKTHRPATLVKCDKVADLALIAFEAKGVKFKCAPLASAFDPKCAVTQVGFPGGRGPNVRKGRALGWLVGGVKSCESCRCELATQQGDSGSGIFNPQGELMALVTGREPIPPYRCACVDCLDIAQLLKEVGVGK